MRKILIISISLIFVFLLGIAGFFAYKFLNNQKPTSTTTNNTTENRPQTQTQEITKILDIPVFKYFHLKNSNELVIIQNDGQIIKLKDGVAENLSTTNIPGIFDSLLSYDGSKLIIGFGLPSNVQFSIFDLNKKEWTRLDKKISACAWAPDALKIAYLEELPNKITNLGLATFSTQIKTGQESISFTSITPLSQVDLKLEWLTPEEIFFTQNPSSLINTDIYSFNLNKKTIKPIFSGNGLTTLWGENSQVGLQFSKKNNSPKLSLVNLSGKTIADFSFITLPEKCAFNKNDIYCAIPQFINTSTNILDDYKTKSFITRDDIYKFNTISGQSEKVIDGELNKFDALNLSIINNTIIFKNHTDNLLYQVNIK